MKTIFLILNYKTYHDTIKLTKDLLNKSIGDRKIVIVDNASPNESYTALSQEFINENKVEVISSGENGGYAKGNNYGLRYIKRYEPEYVCIINNDVYFSIETIERLENEYRNIKNIAFLSPLQYLIHQDHPLNFSDMCHIPTLMDDIKSSLGVGKLPRHSYVNNCTYKNLQEVNIVPGAFLFTNYQIFEDIGFFDECTFLFCEERFIAKKVSNAGLHNYLMLDEKYIHAHSVTINSEASLLRQRRMFFDGKILYTRSNRKYATLGILALWIAHFIGTVIFKFKILLREIVK